MNNFFYQRQLTRITKFFLEHHLRRVKKTFKRKVLIRVINYTIKENVNAFITFKPLIIYFQLPEFRKSADYYLKSFLNDNVIDAIRHEFAHLKYPNHGKKHELWQKKIDLFKKDAKKH